MGTYDAIENVEKHCLYKDMLGTWMIRGLVPGPWEVGLNLDAIIVDEILKNRLVTLSGGLEGYSSNARVKTTDGTHYAMKLPDRIRWLTASTFGCRLL